LLIFALLLLAARVAVWSAQDPTRYPLPALVLLAVVAAAELARLTVGGRWLFALTLLLILLGPGARALNRQQTGPAEASAWRNRDLAELSARLPEVAVVAATNPWALWLVTRRRAVLLPTRLDPRPLEGFLAAYGVTHVLITPGAAHPGVEEPMAYAATLAARGWSRMSLERSELLTAPK
jgi:hypothetical protein